MKQKLFLKNHSRMLLAAAMCWLPFQVFASPQYIGGDAVNIRSRPSMAGQILGRLNKGVQVNPHSNQYNHKWTQIELPGSAMVWVSRSFVKNGVVTASNLNVRTGPGVYHDRLGSIPKGTAVKTHNQYRNWYQISAPTGLTAFVASAYVKGSNVGMNVASKLPAASKIPAMITKVVKQKRGEKKAPVEKKKTSTKPVTPIVTEIRETMKKDPAPGLAAITPAIVGSPSFAKSGEIKAAVESDKVEIKPMGLNETGKKEKLNWFQKLFKGDK